MSTTRTAETSSEREERIRLNLAFFATGTPSAKTFDVDEMTLLVDDLAHILEEIRVQRDVNAALQSDLRGLRDEGLCMARELNDQRRERTRLIDLVDSMATAAFHRSNAATAEYRTLVDINSRLRPVETMRPMGASSTTAPRGVAAGGQ